MKFITITPCRFMKDAFKTSDTTLVLAHLIEKDNKYYNACLDFKKAGGKIIMDNSFYELRKNMTLQDLAKKANLIDADVVVLPDLPLKTNIRFVILSIIKKLRSYNVKGKLMMCVYANNRSFKEDLEQFKIMDDIKEIDIIAIPYVFREKDEFKRPEFLDMIEKEMGKKNIKHPIHLFGCNSFENLKIEKRPYVISIDGSLPWKCGYCNIPLPIKDKQDPKRPENYFDILTVTPQQIKCIDLNSTLIKNLTE